MALENFRVLLDDWHESLRDPAQAQERALNRLVELYAKTDYGSHYIDAETDTLEAYQTKFPVTSFDKLQSLIAKVRAGDYRALVP